MEKEKNIIEEEIVEEEVVKKPSKKEKPKVKIGKRIFSIVFWTIVAILAFVWITDYIRVRDNKEPNFCISKKTHEFDDGTVKECIGLGYKTYSYNRTSMATGIELVPFFMNMKEK